MKTEPSSPKASSRCIYLRGSGILRAEFQLQGDDFMSDEKVTENQKTNDELSNEDLEKVHGGAVNAYLIIDGRPGPSTSKQQAIANTQPPSK